MENSDQNIEFILEENNNYHPAGNAHLQSEVTVKKDEANQAYRSSIFGDTIRLLKNAFAFCFEEARLATIGGSDIEHNKIVGQVSTIMRVLTIKDGDLLSHFGEIGETEAENDITSLQPLLVKNQDTAAQKGQNK